jgi:hypothetical protein
MNKPFRMNLKKWSLLASFALWCNSGCGPSQVGSYLSVARQNVIITVSQDATHAAVSMYDIDGNVLGRITDFRRDGAYVRGIAPYDSQSFLVTLDVADRIERVFFDGTHETFHGSALFSGNIFGIKKAGNGLYYAVESNNIEAFDTSGTRNATANIATTTGSCVLSNPRALALDSNGYLVVSAYGTGDRILRYDVSNTVATCVSTTNFGNDPWGIVAHSDGKLYVATQLDDKIYSADIDGTNATVIWDTDLTIIRDPTALLEMPDGTLLVASSYTDTIERIQTDGTRVGNTPFIQDVFSNNIADMMIVEGGPL